MEGLGLGPREVQNPTSVEEFVPQSPSPTKEFWLSGKFLATEHLLSILSISNSFMSLNSFVNLQMKHE